ncbi:MAG TPA: hypothetical protein EYN67_19000 [Flavobacteriales bacterium]|nr:hypothetical protein [Methylococcaceae bacterium]HHZ97575.1 hypothetical protein [Flavobacteriales bacterium]
MLRIYLDNSYIEDNENKTSILVESESLNLNSISYHYDTNSNNVLAIVEGDDAEKLTAFMMPPHSLGTLISDMPVIEIITVTEELTKRNISTSGSVTAGDLINNICKFFNADFKSLGSIIERDFS